MNLFKTAFLSAIETSIKLGAGFVVLKYIAIQTGPEGVACFGQFQNLIASCIILISGASPTGLVCYSAIEKSNNQAPVYLGNALGIGVFCSIVIGLLIFVFATTLSKITFKSDEYVSVFYLLSFACIFIMFYQTAVAMLNGWGEMFKLIACKSASSLMLLFFSLLFVHYYGLKGGLVALIGMQSGSAFFALWLLKNIRGFEWSWIRPRMNFVICKELMSYWLMSLVTLISTPLILILVRVSTVDQLGWKAAGIWEASWKLSELYLLVITTALTTYYIPKLSRSKTLREELLIVKEVLFYGVVCAAILALGVYILRYWIISLLYTKDFIPVAGILKYQLIGSVVKIAAWVLAYHMLVKRRLALFLISELFFGATFYVISKLCLVYFGLEGLSAAYLVNYLLYLAFCASYFITSYVYRNNKLDVNLCLSQ